MLDEGMSTQVGGLGKAWCLRTTGECFKQDLFGAVQKPLVGSVACAP